MLTEGILANTLRQNASEGFGSQGECKTAGECWFSWWLSKGSTQPPASELPQAASHLTRSSGRGPEVVWKWCGGPDIVRKWSRFFLELPPIVH